MKWRLFVLAFLVSCDIAVDVHDNVLDLNPDLCSVLNPSMNSCEDPEQDRSLPMPRYEAEPCGVQAPCDAGLLCACEICFDVADLGL